ncbi:MAG: SRPBCC family protein [Acidimicrobiales bacterium]
MHHELHTEIDIDASPEVVWQVLTDLDHYPEWNPFITSSVGEPEVGNQLVNRMEPPGGKAITFKPRVTLVEDGKSFEWLGKLGLSGVFDGRHRFDIEASPTGTRFVQRESLDGVLVRFLRKSLDTTTKSGFEAMNAALKARAESVAAG